MILQADIPLSVPIFNGGVLKVGVDDLHTVDLHLNTIADAANDYPVPLTCRLGHILSWSNSGGDNSAKRMVVKRQFLFK